jgi:hypothetical protein
MNSGRSAGSASLATAARKSPVAEGAGMGNPGGNFWHPGVLQVAPSISSTIAARRPVGAGR